MDLNKVFIGYTYDGVEHAFYKRKSTFSNGVNYTEYMDIETMKKIDISQVDLITLFPFLEIFPINKKRMFRRKVKNFYKMDRDMIIDASTLFYGDIIKKNFRKLGTTKGILIQENVLFMHSTSWCWYSQDLLMRVDYPKFTNDSKYVETIINRRKPECNYCVNGWSVPKRKLLEMKYRKEL